MAGTWRARLRALEEMIGEGDLVGRVVVDQRYAAYQHVHQDLNHPLGGGPNYLSRPLLERARRHTRQLARGFLDDGAKAAMADNLEDICAQVAILAPLDFNDLRRSASPTVEDRGNVIYHRAPGVKRLTDSELRFKRAILGSRRNRGT